MFEADTKALFAKTVIVTQKRVYVIKSGIKNYLMYSCHVLDKNVTNTGFDLAGRDL